MKELKDLKLILQKAITPDCTFCFGASDIQVNNITNCSILSIEEGDFNEGEYHFIAMANISTPNGNDLSEATFYLDGYFNIDDNENVEICSKITLKKR